MTELQVEELIERLQARSDNTYIDMINIARKDECLGWEAKVRHGKFGHAELKAHTDSAQKYGCHIAYAEAVKMIREIVPAKKT